jgi:hypothetical protein
MRTGATHTGQGWLGVTRLLHSANAMHRMSGCLHSGQNPASLSAPAVSTQHFL